MLEPEMVNSSDAYLISKARDEYNVKIVPITLQTSWAVSRNKLHAAIQFFPVNQQCIQLREAESYTKLLAFNQTQYDRVLSVDSESVLLQAIDELFTLPPAPVAMPRAYWIFPQKLLSSHVMLIKPSKTELTRIMERVQAAVYGEYDMEIVNQLYRDSALMFPHRRYALLSGEFCNDNHTLHLGSGIEVWDPVSVYSEAKLIHFSDWPLPKPWKPIAEEKRLEVQPNCTRTADGMEDCTGRTIWNRLYTDFSAKRKEICDHERTSDNPSLDKSMSH
ncbi:nucleotide-diphospho-sugar transferase [Fusarium tricinctum]|uniref:Nucleotide-diphospho-sugar transferase n=1 Tax=Fusarium tricinctum TaxID=61284 RepID=A0A8K0SA83_9HYPO|nr:nucleotide-diphospho-sugar transferase [Fusarium tricinctum]